MTLSPVLPSLLDQRLNEQDPGCWLVTTSPVLSMGPRGVNAPYIFVKLNTLGNVTGRRSHLVDEVQGNSSLPDFHLFGLPVFSILVPDLVHTLLQPPSGLVFLPVFLTLQRPNPKGGLLRDGE